VTAVAVVGILSINAVVIGPAGARAYQDYREGRPDYIREHGQWQTIELPDEYRVRAIHTALLYSGEVLLLAGSGNSRKAFEAGTFETVLWNPVTGDTTKVDTPEDLFCGGHAYLPNGDLLVAGGTSKYEVLPDNVKKAAGALWIKNESGEPFEVKKGDVWRRANGMEYVTTEDRVIPAARDVDGKWTSGQANVWVEAVEEGKEYAMTEHAERIDLTRLSNAEQQNLYGWSNVITMDKQNYAGLDSSYIYSVEQRKYIKTEDMNFARWYPTLVSLNGDNIIAVSGLDEHGYILEGQNEVFNVGDGTWHYDGKVDRFFPTYPSLFRMADGRLFYSGSSTGYGAADEGRQPGLWDVSDNSWQDVDGLRDPEMNETSSSVMLAPAQDQRVAIIGGGGVGESDKSTNRIDIVDLDASDTPRYEPGPDYPEPGRYISAVTLPDDKTLLTGGSRDYRGRSLSDLRLTMMLDPATNTLIEAAPNHIGRNYHSTAALLPDGSVMTIGSDPLFGDEHNHTPGTFETRIEVYRPPYLFTGTPRPEILAAPASVERGERISVEVTGDIDRMRLIRPSAVTHLTDPEQRSIALEDLAVKDGIATGIVPDSLGMVPSGYYMLFAIDSNGVPSIAKWVRVES
jgi:hypothetical protein